jgi:ribosomal protein S18 acetylase RimI-like enzyme
VTAPEVVVRDATPDDLPDAIRLLVTGFADVFGPAFGRKPVAVQQDVLLRLRHCRPEPAAGLVVAVCDGQIVGVTEWCTSDLPGAPLPARLRVLSRLGVIGAVRFVVRTLSLRPRLRPGEAYLPGTVVAPRMRGRGVGRALLLRSLEVTAASGVHTWRDFVAESNHPSRAMLAGLGFAEVRRIRPSWWRRRLGQQVTVQVERCVEPATR